MPTLRLEPATYISGWERYRGTLCLSRKRIVFSHPKGVSGGRFIKHPVTPVDWSIKKIYNVVVKGSDLLILQALGTKWNANAIMNEVFQLDNPQEWKTLIESLGVATERMLLTARVIAYPRPESSRGVEGTLSLSTKRLVWMWGTTLGSGREWSRFQMEYVEAQVRDTAPDPGPFLVFKATDPAGDKEEWSIQVDNPQVWKTLIESWVAGTYAKTPEEAGPPKEVTPESGKGAATQAGKKRESLENAAKVAKHGLKFKIAISLLTIIIATNAGYYFGVFKTYPELQPAQQIMDQIWSAPILAQVHHALSLIVQDIQNLIVPGSSNGAPSAGAQVWDLTNDAGQTATVMVQPFTYSGTFSETSDSTGWWCLDSVGNPCFRFNIGGNVAHNSPGDSWSFVNLGGAGGGYQGLGTAEGTANSNFPDATYVSGTYTITYQSPLGTNTLTGAWTGERR